MNDGTSWPAILAELAGALIGLAFTLYVVGLVLFRVVEFLLTLLRALT